MTTKKKKIKKAEQALQTRGKQIKCADYKQTYPEIEWQEWFARLDTQPNPITTVNANSAEKMMCDPIVKSVVIMLKA